MEKLNNLLQPALKLAQDIRFWIVILTLLRLQNVTEPPIDDHSWRQCLTLMTARNLLEVDNNILYPRLDITGELSGITGCEFPFMNYLLFIFYKLFGYQDWYGRLLNVLVSSAGLWFVYQVFKRLTNQSVAFYGTLFLGISVFFKYSRKTMPDTFSMALVFMGMYFVWRFFEDEKNRHLLIAFILLALGLLSKMPSACLLCFMLPLFFEKPYFSMPKIKMGGTVAAAVAVMGAWYFIWVPYLTKTYQYPFFWPYPLKEGWAEIVRLSELTWLRFNVDAFGTRASFLVAVMGLGGFLLHKQHKLTLIIIPYSIIFFFFIIKTGPTFPTHEYYVLPYVPMMSLAAGYFIGTWTINSYLKAAIAFLLLNMNLNVQRLDIIREDKAYYMQTLPAIVDKYVGKDEKIATAGEFAPICMYWSHRKGWTFRHEVFNYKHWMPGYKNDGLRYFVIDRKVLPDTLSYPLIYEDANFRIYKP